MASLYNMCTSLRLGGHLHSVSCTWALALPGPVALRVHLHKKLSKPGRSTVPGQRPGGPGHLDGDSPPGTKGLKKIIHNRLSQYIS